jgi:hypothetical protein
MTEKIAPFALTLSFAKGNLRTFAEIPVDQLVVAGWTGRDPEAMEAHIVELEKLGVARPKSTPIFYRAAAALLTTNSTIEVVGPFSSGEVEPVILSSEDGLWLGVGSDHTDRKVETIGVTISKQLCAKPVSNTFWPFAEVENHWDKILIRSFAVKDGNRRLYQEGPLSKMRHPRDLMDRYCGAGSTLPIGTVMFCGTLAVHGAIEPAEAYDLEIEDPVLKRIIQHRYSVVTLPIEG